MSDETAAEEPQDEGYDLDPSPKQERQTRERAIAEQVAQRFELERTEFRGQQLLTAPLGKVIQVLEALKTESAWRFERLVDVTATDMLKLEGEHPERFSVLYLLHSMTHNAQLRLRVWVDEDDPVVPTASRIYASANWGEREVYDMFGIEFAGHPNLERILMPIDFGSFPLRKDYPLRGRGERDDFPRLRRGGKEDI